MLRDASVLVIDDEEIMRDILQTLLELGRLNAREMQQVLRLDLSDVDDHIFFWKGDNVRAALAAVVTGSGFAEVERRARPFPVMQFSPW